LKAQIRKGEFLAAGKAYNMTYFRLKRESERTLDSSGFVQQAEKRSKTQTWIKN